MPFEGAGGGSGAVLSRSRTARPGEKWRQGGGWTPRAGRDTRRPETAGGALVSRRHGPWTSIRVCANVCVTAARVGSESEKRRDKLDGRAQGCTRSAWGPDRLGTAIGCDLPDKFDKYRCRGTDVPEPPVSQRGNGRCAVRGTGASGKNCIGWLAACCACCKHACGKYQSLSLI